MIGVLPATTAVPPNTELPGQALFGPAQTVAADGVHGFVSAGGAVLVFDSTLHLVAWTRWQDRGSGGVRDNRSCAGRGV